MRRHRLRRGRLGGRRLREFAAGRLRGGLGGPLGVLVEVILGRSGGLAGIGVRVTGGIHGNVRIVVIVVIVEVGERVDGTDSRLLAAQFFGKLVVIGVGCQILELTGNFLLLGFLTSA